MEKIRNRLEKLWHQVTKRRIPPKYRNYTREQWELEFETVRDELEKIQKSGSGSLDEMIKFLEKNQDFLAAVDILKKQQMRKILHDIKYKI